MARIVLNTFGSLGDLHPFLAIAIELRRRGHESLIATAEVYRQKIEGEGIGFAPVRPDVGEILDDPALLAKLWHPSRGTEYVIRDYLAPNIEKSYQDLAQAAAGADLLLTHVAGYAGPIVAEVQKLRWLSIALQPSIFLSTYDPPILPATWLRHFYPLGRHAVAALFALGKARVRSWVKPIVLLRTRLGLSTTANPVFEGQFSPYGTLALFSKYFALPQADWPDNLAETGFVFYDQLGASLVDNSGREAKRLANFLDGGPAPIVFTLGPSAVMHPGSFFEQSVRAAQQLGMRAVLLTGKDEAAGNLPPSVFATSYAPYSQLLPRAAVTVHQGGIGTTAQALLAGKPMLVVPWSHDQPDNAERLRKLGVARTLDRGRYTGGTAADAIRQLVQKPEYVEKADRLSRCLATEHGVCVACDRIEAALNDSAARSQSTC